MLFNSFEFILFFPFVYLLHWYVFSKTKVHQNTILILASYVFYGWWSIYFLGLLIFGTIIDYLIAFKIASTNSKNSKRFLILGILLNIIVLIFFKYNDFFLSDLIAHLKVLGIDFELLKIIVPVGISFYTFHGMSYLFDVYRKKQIVEKSFLNYALFVSYFPLLVAGPIERAHHLLPQLKLKRNFSYTQSVQGLQLIVVGFFKKIVISDCIAYYVNPTFENSSHYTALSLLITAIGFSFQIYADFSGYSDIARGISKLLGIELLQNFNLPYFSKNIQEFWKRWHISLTSWFKDYLYIPLGGNREGKIKTIRNIAIVFFVSAFWHGAKTTFLVWGIIHAIFYLIEYLTFNQKKTNVTVYDSKIKPFLSSIFTFTIVTIAWVFFRSESIEKALLYFKQIALSTYEDPENYFKLPTNYEILYFVAVSLIIEILFRKNQSTYDHRRFFWIAMIITNLTIFYFLTNEKSSFIYFQF